VPQNRDPPIARELGVGIGTVLRVTCAARQTLIPLFVNIVSIQ
jgi:hypothetical protein